MKHLQNERVLNNVDISVGVVDSRSDAAGPGG